METTNEGKERERFFTLRKISYGSKQVNNLKTYSTYLLRKKSTIALDENRFTLGLSAIDSA